MTSHRPRALCIVLHDVAGATRPACERALAAIADVAGRAPVTLLAVPRYHRASPPDDLAPWLDERLARGDELALHGYTHRDDGTPAGWIDALRRSSYTRGEGEFWALSKAEALTRIDAGLAWFASHGWPVSGFVAPAWLLGPGARAAIGERPFEYTATLRSIERLADGAAAASQSVVYSTSSGWRRATSLAWNAAVARIESGNPLLRLELHPRDADFAPVRRSWQRILERALGDRQPTTVAAFVRTLPAAARRASAASEAATAD